MMLSSSSLADDGMLARGSQACQGVCCFCCWWGQPLSAAGWVLGGTKDLRDTLCEHRVEHLASLLDCPGQQIHQPSTYPRTPKHQRDHTMECNCIYYQCFLPCSVPI